MFGFNKADVNMYLMKLQQEFAFKEQELTRKLENLEKENSDLKERCNSTQAEFNSMKDEFAYLKGKEQEIEQMSESIGTMYMVAMQNAQEIIGEAEECAKEINRISALRLEAAEVAEEQLKAIKENIKTSAEQLAEDINSMTLSLEEPKSRLVAQLNSQNLPTIPMEFKNEDTQN